MYDWREIVRLMHFPRRLRFVEDYVQKMVSAGGPRHDSRHDANGSATSKGPPLHDSELEALAKAAFSQLGRLTYEVPPPWNARPYINDYVMEATWSMVLSYGAPKRQHNFSLPKCLDRDVYFRAYRKVQGEVGPRAPLLRCLPPRKAFLAVHVRGGDKEVHMQGASKRRHTAGQVMYSAAIGRHPYLRDRRLTISDSLLHDNRTWRALGAVVSAHAQLPWYAVSDTPSMRRYAEERLAGLGARLGSPRTACDAHGAASHDARTDTTRAVLRDFFLLHAAAGVVAIAPNTVNNGLAESSFATVAALAGDAPLLTPAPFVEAGVLPLLEARSQALLRGAFFLDDLSQFILAIGNASVRYRIPAILPNASIDRAPINMSDFRTQGEAHFAAHHKCDIKPIGRASQWRRYFCIKLARWNMTLTSRPPPPPPAPS